MKFTDIFIKRPVLSIVVALLILLVGIRCFSLLSLREYPYIDNTQITITTAYPGANATLMKNFITQPIAQSVATADGIDYMTAESTQGSSLITINVKLGYDSNAAFTDVMSKVSQVENQLPKASDQPVIQKTTGSGMDLMYLSYNSQTMSPEQITAYLNDVVQPKLETVEGVSKAEILGPSTFAMRIWLSTQEMNALGVTAADVSKALASNNVQSAAGTTKGSQVLLNIQATTDLNTVEQFKELIVKNVDGRLVHLGDVADVELGKESYDASVYFDGKPGVFIGIAQTTGANPLTVIQDVRKVLPQLESNYPPGLEGTVVYDATKYISTSISEVEHTIFESCLIVVLVILLFLGSIRSVIIPVVAIPLSIFGVGTIMLALGYSINLLTLLAFVLAIGMVVDDAIVVVENIYRHIEEGMSAKDAALQGAREIATPVISMSITLAAVYAPVGLMSGLTGQLFSEFAFTLAGTVILSGVIALVLSPMMCSKVLSPKMLHSSFVNKVDGVFNGLQSRYQKRLALVLNYVPVVLVMAVVVLGSCYFFYTGSQSELAPAEDQGAIVAVGFAPEYANVNYVEKYTAQMGKIAAANPAVDHYFFINGFKGQNSAMGIVTLKPWDQRSVSQAKVQAEFQQQFNNITGMQTQVVAPPSLPGVAVGPPVQFVLTSTSNYKDLYEAQEKMVAAANSSGLFLFAMGELDFDKPVITYDINRDKATALGISMDDIANTLAGSLGGNYLQWFSMGGKSFKVIPQLQQQDRLNPDEINNINISTANGELVPLSSIVTAKESIEANSLTQFQQLNSATVAGIPRPGVSTGTVISYLEKTAQATLPKDITYDFSGASRQYIQEGSALMYTFFFSLVIIYLVLAAQFESFTDPLIILITVPMSICGALLPIYFGLASVNIYTQIGLITLIGLISKHGILIVEFANKLQENERLSKYDAIIKAAATRMRPILMTTAAMVFGVFPLIFATGAGAVSRFDIGIVIAMGMSVGTAFTLFVVPSMYILLAKDRSGIIKDK